MIIPHKLYFLTELRQIIDEIKTAKKNNDYLINVEYFSFNIENCYLVSIDLEKNQDIWDHKTNFLDYYNEENEAKIRILSSLWNSGNPIKTLPPILDWVHQKKHFTILDGLNRARLFSNIFAGDDAEGEMIFLFKKESYDSLPEHIKPRVHVM